MQRSNHFDLNVDQVAKLNKILSKGYKVISVEENNKRVAQIKKKPKIAYVPIAELKSLEPVSVGRRAKDKISYYEGDEPTSNKPVQDYEP